MLTRRSVLLTAAATAACATRAAGDPDALLDHAIARMGGAEAIGRSRVLAWRGHAAVHPGPDALGIGIGVETIVEPFVYARSDTWLLERGPADVRSLQISGDSGVIIRGGQRSTMPAGMLANERAQFATYGLMRLVSLRDAGATYERAPVPSNALPSWRYALAVTHPCAAPSTLYFDNSIALCGLDNVVPNAEDRGAPIAQRFAFSELCESPTGLYWPASLHVAQNGVPFFDLVFDSFTPRLSR